MNSAEYVSDLTARLKADGIPLQEVAWQTALACVGWAYVFGASGQFCTPSNRRSAYQSHGADHPTIKSACKGFNDSNCSGCKWYPSGKRTRYFDCRGFTYWVLKVAYNWELKGAGATSQWSNGSNWKAKGTIDTMPRDVLCCLFVNKGAKMEHTGFGLNEQTIECSSGVQHFNQRNKKWTHWAVPVVVEGEVTPVPEPTPDKGTAIVTGKNLALRQGPGTDKSVMTRIPTGKTVKLIDLPSDWTYVEYNGKKGFVMNQYIKVGE